MYRIVRIDNRQYLVSYSAKAEAIGQALIAGQKVTKKSVIEIGECLKSDKEIIEALDTYRSVYGEHLSTDYRS
ncbi:hypothetical protein A6770_14990 [Nostoc minutum NIES-26]|uniref:Uncharacterized protein n=1 Tax=Nostoc minutum NIES-26 TaxID=1844469 RepID=A0A367RMI1_9NOSO|nr:hypothetical protein A6770_14990 [Nostoc minutum NIES-26]